MVGHQREDNRGIEGVGMKEEGMKEEGIALQDIPSETGMV